MLFKRDQVWTNGVFNKEDMTIMLQNIAEVESNAKQEGYKMNRYMKKLISGNYALPDKTMRKAFHEAYVAEPLYIARKSIYKEKPFPCDSYDLHSAYGYGLKNKVFPLTTEITKEKTECGLVWVKINKYEKKYKWAEYDIYKYLLEQGEFYISILGLENLKRLWNIEITQIQYAYFKECGKLNAGFQEYHDICFKKKEKLKRSGNKLESDAFKMAFNCAQYGYFARKYKQTDRYKPIPSSEISEGRNEPTVVIAMYQTEYVRQYMLDVFERNIKDFVYMNTDGIILKHNDSFKKTENIGPNLGQFGIKYENLKTLFYRFSVYLVFNKNKSLNENSCMGAINIEPTADQINQICKHTPRIKWQNVKLDTNGEATLYDLDLTNGYEDESVRRLAL